MTALAERVAAIAAQARVRAVSDRERIQRENAELFAWRVPFLAMGTSEHLVEFATRRVWGKTAEERARDAGGLGVSVVASASRKGKK